MESLSTAFSAFDLQFVAVAVIASLVVLLAATVVASGIHQLGKSHRANALHAEKAATYQLFTDLWGTLLQPGGMPEDGGPYPWPGERQAMDRLMALCGSSSVVRAYAAFRASAVEGGANSPRLRSQFAETLLEMRKDLGAETRNLTAGELQQLFFANSGEGGPSVSASAGASRYQDIKPRVPLASSLRPDVV
jgi:hypothetical protein